MLSNFLRSPILLILGRKIENVKIHIAVLAPIERIAELTFHEQDMLAEHDELPDKTWVAEFWVTYTWRGGARVEWVRVRVVMDAYTGDRLSVFELNLPSFPSFTRK